MAEQVTPYNCELMVYDVRNHRYELTVHGVEQLSGIDLIFEKGNEYEAKKTLKKASDIIYRFIYKHKFPNQIPYIEYLLAKDDTLRDTIMNALVGQIEYDNESGALALENQHGIDMLSASTRVIQNHNFRGYNAISQKSIDVLNQKGLLYSNYTQIIPNFEYRKDY